MIKTCHWKTPFGELILAEHKEKVCMVDWKHRKMRDSIDKRIKSHFQADFKEERTELLEEVIHQLQGYFDGKRKSFTLPLYLVGTSFQKSVWEALQQIPYGKTESYLGLSQKLNNEKAIRAVASANGANAISIILPCHRVIGTDGDLTGYAGGLTAKQELLQLEGAVISDQLELL